MPEGPEVWILSQAINRCNKVFNTTAYGKHLIIEDTMEGDTIYLDWSFGLTGKVRINDIELTKVKAGFVYGDESMSREKSELLEGLGHSWMHADKEQLQTVVNKWATSKRTLGALLLDQSQISGIGVAWGSEILCEAALTPNEKACNQDLNKLVDSLLNVKNKVQQVYASELDAANDITGFVNSWFNNLYEVRNMKVYKQGTPLKVAGRTWWV